MFWTIFALIMGICIASIIVLNIFAVRADKDSKLRLVRM